MSEEQAKAIETSGNLFKCSICQGTIDTPVQSAKSSSSSTSPSPSDGDEVVLAKRKRSDNILTSKNNKLSPTNDPISPSDELSFNKNKKLKTICVVSTCHKPAKTDWVYCSFSCIRRHVNEILDLIQKTKLTVNKFFVFLKFNVNFLSP